jgi:protein SCO1/2
VRRAAWAGLLALALTGCASRGEPQAGPYRGVEIAEPIAKPDLEFVDSRGRPFRLVDGTAGKVTLLFFGYTSCPDICPVHLANIAAVLDKLPDEVQRNIAVIFVTTDPVRDSLPVLHRWVTGFNREFIGLTGTDSAIVGAQRALGLVPAERTVAQRRDGYLVGHATQVIAFTRDGMARVQYPFATRQRDWAHDLPKLVEFGRTP